MRVFIDTSVLVAVAQDFHPHHHASMARVSSFSKAKTGCGAHTLAELYSTLTRIPPPMRFRPEQALLVLEDVLSRMQIVSLLPDEYVSAIRRTAGLGLSGGLIYDALHLECARKFNAERIYTWDARHFRMIAPDLADRIVEP